MEPVELREEVALRGLTRAAFPVPDSSLEILRASFKLLRDTELLINATAPDKVWEGQWALLGLLRRGYELALSCLAMLETRNLNGFYAALRGLIEALCAVYWCQESLGRLPRLVSLEAVSVGKMLNAGYKRTPAVKTWYGVVSGTVHPARGGHLLMWRRSDSWGTGLMTAFDSTYSIAFFEEQMNGLTTFLPLFAMELRRLAELPGAVTFGRTMAAIRGSSHVTCPPT